MTHNGNPHNLIGYDARVVKKLGGYVILASSQNLRNSVKFFLPGFLRVRGIEEV